MLLTFRILSYCNLPVPPAPPVRMTAAGGSIGRSPDSDLVLDDPGKYISRLHARVLAQGDTFMLEDLGSNASVVNDRPLGKGNTVALAHGDRLAIGDYRMQILIEAAPAAAPLAAAPVNDTALPLFEPPPPAAPVQLPPFQSASTGSAAPAALPAAPGDPFAGGSLLDVSSGQVPFASDDPLGLNLFGSAPASPARAAESDHVSPELAALSRATPLPPSSAPLSPASAAGFSIPAGYDPLADFFAPPAAAFPPIAPAASVAEDITAFIAQLPPAAPAAPVASAALASPASLTSPVAAASDAAVLQALLRGLGVPHLPLQRPATEVAEMVGQLLREATAGTMDVLMARAVTKKESRIDMTMLSVRANNPLKFFPNAEGALTQMLTGAMAGYMAPVDAMAGAFDDLRAHELAVIAGMRAALGAVLHRFDPAQIEARLAEPTVMDRMLASARKARMWDRLVALYGEIAREADDDLQRLFGEAFSAAYEEQVARLRQLKQGTAL
ncbi:type VI secretion system-associated FHA domain protein TagH [Pseudoduganella lurida]|nr:type VI secretion system-associated FHA domain protein TagH [Pseudoduganella lurida]